MSALEAILFIILFPGSFIAIGLAAAYIWRMFD